MRKKKYRSTSLISLSILLSSLPLLQASQSKAEKIMSVLDELEDFTHYSQRSFETSSRAEAIEHLKQHCNSLISYHQDLEDMYSERYNNYNNLKQKNEKQANTSLSLFFTNLLGFKLPTKTKPIEFLNRLKILHVNYKKIWTDKLTGLKERTVNINNQYVQLITKMQENHETFKMMSNKLKEDFSDLYLSMRNVRKNPALYVKSKIFKMAIDELWALRYAHALVTPWAGKNEERELPAFENIQLAKVQNDPSVAIPPSIVKKKKKAKKKNKILELSSVLIPEKKIKDSTKVTPTFIVAEKIEESIKEISTFITEEKDVASVREKPVVEKGKRKTVDIKNSIFIKSDSFIDKESYATLMDMFDHKKVFFDDFCKSFQKGLGGKIIKNKGGSMVTFEKDKYSFVLHKPHGRKGKSEFYDILRNMAIKRLENIGITKDFLSKISM